ncbi:MAG: HAMP domain-containing protein [Sedimentisphaerales bacterium]|nr:HAMP domain-containing protein [Sedimentisphaerales bacterium]
MRLLNNISIKHKLTGITMLTCVITLVLAGVAFVAWQWRSSRIQMTEDLAIHAEMIANNCSASLAFDDPQDAARILQGLHAKASIVFAGIYSKNGKQFASYRNADAPADLQQTPIEGNTHILANGYLTVSMNIVLDNEVIGIVFLQSDLTPMKKMVMQSIKITVAVLLFAALIAYVVASRLQKLISEPILKLAVVAKIVSENEDYSTRAAKQANDEVGFLIDAFNEMLEQIQKRDWELVEAKTQLETRVEQRTEELSSANAKLESQIEVRKKIETKQRSILSKLESANKDLKDFAYIVSHDLKAPLRGIKTLTDWICADYADKINEDGREQLSLLSNRVDRMHNLIEGILEYSRVGRVREKMAQIDLNRLVPEIIDLIAPPQNISITVEDELPVINCEPTRISQIFQNLLSNAVKYMDKPQGRITIGCVAQENMWQFSVADNGPGIEKRHFEKVFQMFQTLSPRDAFESTGVGLTVIKKIIEMYGGTIWIVSEPGQGSTFLFTLPKKELEVTDAKRQTNTAC